MTSSSRWSTLLTNIVAPAGLLVAYLYWFAYVQASAYYGFFGVRGAVGLQLQNKENAADGILALFSPIAIIALVALAASAAHPAMVAAVSQQPKPAFIIRAILLLAAFFFAAFLVDWLPATFLSDSSGGPGWPEYLMGAVGVLLFNYALHLSKSYVRRSRNADRRRLWLSAILLLALSLAATSSYASDLGFERALRVVENGELRRVAVYSEDDQSLTGPGIIATKLSATDGYRYRYTGLRLLAVRDTHFILVPESMRPGPPTAIIVTEGDGVRMEISLS